MAALDFPSAPTVGQQYAAPNGVTYQWDGAAWVVTGGPPTTPTGPAGGDLTGTYPNPTIGLTKVTTAKLAVGATILVNQQQAPSLPVGTLAGATEATIASVPALTYRGGIVLLVADITMRTYFPDDNTCVLRLYLDSTLLGARNFRGGVQSTVGAADAVVVALAVPTAGSHTFSFRWIRTSGTGNFELVSAQLTAVELA